jgi:serine protease Do
MRGEVVGINSQIYSRSGGFMGISFAIPIDEAHACRSSCAQRPGRSAAHRRADRPGHQGGRRVDRPGQADRRAGAQRRSRRPGREGRRRGGRHHHQVRRARVDKAGDLPRIVGSTKPGTHSTLQVFRRGKYRDLSSPSPSSRTSSSAGGQPSASKPRRPQRQLGLPCPT